MYVRVLGAGGAVLVGHVLPSGDHLSICVLRREVQGAVMLDFNRAAATAKLAFRLDVHGFADAVRHEPSGLVCHAKGAVQLVAAHALLRGTQKVSSQYPLVKRHLRAFKDRAHRYRVLAAAVAAEIQACAMRLAFELRLAIRATAMRAHGALRPAEGF